VDSPESIDQAKDRDAVRGRSCAAVRSQALETAWTKNADESRAVGGLWVTPLSLTSRLVLDGRRHGQGSSMKTTNRYMVGPSSVEPAPVD